MKSETIFSRIINSLAEKFISEPFQPHLTLAGVPDWDEERMVEEVKNIAGSTSQLELPLEKVRCKHSPYQKITVEVERAEALSSLHQRTNNHFEGSYSKTDYPHISLLYSHLECEGLQQIISEINEYIPQKVLLNRIALVRCKGTPDDWRTLYIGKMG